MSIVNFHVSLLLYMIITLSLAIFVIEERFGHTIALIFTIVSTYFFFAFVMNILK